MKSRIAPALFTLLLLASAAGAESHSGTIGFAADEIVGTISFTALAPGETASGFGPFAGYSQAVSGDYTYLYRVENDSAAGTPTRSYYSSAANTPTEHSFIDVDLRTLLDPNNAAQIHTIGFDASNGGEEPSSIDPGTAPNVIDYQFDGPLNSGILALNGASAILRFFSPIGPSSEGGALITNDTAPFDNFAEIQSGVTTPLPEPGTTLLLLAGLAGLAVLRRFQ